MTPICIDIPDAPERPSWDAAGIVIAALRKAGIDPHKALCSPVMQALCVSWARGDSTDAEFANACRNMLILCPALAEPREH